MPAGSYGWAGVIFGLLAILVFIFWQIRRRVNIETEVERETQTRLDAERRAKEHEAALDVERRDLPPGVAGPRVREVPPKLGQRPPDP